MGKKYSRGMLVIYLGILIWLVVFKLDFHILRVFDNQHRSLNLIPFAAPAMSNQGGINYGDMVFNCLFFIPFGLLLNVNFKKPGFLPMLITILVFSISVETIQYIFAIGATDITDVMMNTGGGLLGLIIYILANKFICSEKLDRFILIVGIFIFVVFLSIHLSHLLRRTAWK